jgi:hypothetical protein
MPLARSDRPAGGLARPWRALPAGAGHKPAGHLQHPPITRGQDSGRGSVGKLGPGRGLGRRQVRWRGADGVVGFRRGPAPGMPMGAEGAGCMMQFNGLGRAACHGTPRCVGTAPDLERAQDQGLRGLMRLTGIFSEGRRGAAGVRAGLSSDFRACNGSRGREKRRHFGHAKRSPEAGRGVGSCSDSCSLPHHHAKQSKQH